MSGLIEVSTHGAACVIRLNRERKLNALSTELEGDLERAIASAAVRDAGCVVFAGGERAFSAGADRTEMRSVEVEQVLAYYAATGDVYERIAGLRQPTVAAIRGWCLGGGLELALACDFRVAGAEAVFGLPEVEIGILPSSGGTLRLVRAVGAARAKELMLLRPRFSAAEALGYGVVGEVVEGDPLPRALEWATRLAALPRLATQVAKQAADAMADSSREAAIMIERLAYAALAQTGDARRAGEDFAARRDG
ncbi:MAG TPA: enoyl-CoA hydratase/isomerase family protein [Gaiellales bacterium]|jgi:enoyl-CoA hydratase/carnithine racemase|nr:enoyl-CoA hydratase/isomerase family protein [Gaiellales bacterium]